MIYVVTITRDSIKGDTASDTIQLLRNDSNLSYAIVMGSYIQTLREGSASAVLASGATHILFIDSDMMFPFDTAKQLLSRDKDIIAANYVQRVEQEKWTAIINGESVVSANKTGIQEVDSIGMGVCLIKMDVFKKLPKPWFSMPWQNGGYYVGEDIYFCGLAKSYGYSIWIDHDLSQKVHHIGDVRLGVDRYLLQEYVVPNIDGWLHPEESQFLYHEAKDMDSIVEIGSWKGRSTHALASGCKGKVHCVDNWLGSDDDPTQELSKKEDVFSIFKKNMEKFSNIEIHKGFSHDISSSFDEKVDMVFIDADHHYEAVKQDIEDWLPKTKKLICGHDYQQGWSGVMKAVDEKFGKPDGVVGTIWYKVLS